jgi:7-cyano-7-deazaguanine synthase
MPLLSLRKRQVVRLGQQVGAPWHLTHSCQRGGGGEPCGACASCEARAAAFEAAGVEDPLPLHHLAEAGGA